MSSPAPEYSEHGEDWSHVRDEHKSDPKPVPAESPLSFHPDIRSPGLESVWNGDQGKEAIPPEHLDYTQGKIPVAPYEPGQLVRPKRRICGIPRVLFILFAFLVILGLALGVGLGVGLATNHRCVPCTVSSPKL